MLDHRHASQLASSWKTCSRLSAWRGSIIAPLAPRSAPRSKSCSPEG